MNHDKYDIVEDAIDLMDNGLLIQYRSFGDTQRVETIETSMEIYIISKGEKNINNDGKSVYSFNINSFTSSLWRFLFRKNNKDSDCDFVEGKLEITCFASELESVYGKAKVLITKANDDYKNEISRLKIIGSKNHKGFEESRKNKKEKENSIADEKLKSEEAFNNLKL